MSTSVFEPARKKLEQVFQDGWASRTPIKFDNAAFQQPANAAFVGFFVRWGIGQQVSIGSAGRRLERHAGVVMIQVFVPKDAGPKDLDDHCDFAANLMRMQTLTDSTAGIEIEVRSPTRSFGGSDKELRQDNISVEIQVDALF